MRNPKPRSFIVATFNGHDNAYPARAATFLALQERAVGDQALADHLADLGLTAWLPMGIQEGIAWDPSRFALEDRGVEFLHKSGRTYGHPNTSPPRHAPWIAGVVDQALKVAVIAPHLVNNAWGPSIRGERQLRRFLWWKGWRKVLRLRRRLRRLGYLVFIAGDLNRKRAWWERLARVLGVGFDRILYPLEVDLEEAWTGDPNGSDHRPLFGKFRANLRAKLRGAK